MHHDPMREVEDFYDEIIAEPKIKKGFRKTMASVGGRVKIKRRAKNKISKMSRRKNRK